MKIGELAKMTGITPSRIRFYEAEGLITAPPRQRNGYRHYPAETADLLRIIDNARQVGFSLQHIRRFLPRPQARWDHDELIQALNARIAEIEQMQKQLDANKKVLLDLIDGIANRPAGISCTDNMQRLIGQVPVSEDDSGGG